MSLKCEGGWDNGEGNLNVDLDKGVYLLGGINSSGDLCDVEGSLQAYKNEAKCQVAGGRKGGEKIEAEIKDQGTGDCPLP